MDQERGVRSNPVLRMVREYYCKSIEGTSEEDIMSDKRRGYITWDEYFMGVAKLSAMRSKDPNTQVG